MAQDRDHVSSLSTRPGGQATAEELQQLLRAKRQSITQTVEEIKMTMHSGFQDSKDKITETLDWRHQVQHYPLAAVAGALAIGFLAGQVLGRGMGSSRSISGSRRSISGSTSFGAGSSLPSSTSGMQPQRPHKERHFVPPAVKSKFMSRMEEVLTELSDNLMTEVSRVGRDVIVPTLVSNLTNAFTHERSRGASGMSGFSGSTGRASYSSKSTTESAGFSSQGSGMAAGGPISGSDEDQSSGGRFQGRGGI